MALFAPGSTPGVSNYEVVQAVLGTVSDSGDSVVNLIATVSIVQDTFSVHLEGTAAGMDGNAGWLLVNGCLDLTNFSGCNSSIRTNGNFASYLGLSTSLLPGYVWVISQECHWVLLSPSHGRNFQATVASVVAGIAVDHMLLRKLFEISSFDSICALYNCSSRECPARATLPLVLDFVDYILSSPVDTTCHDGFVELESLSSINSRGLPFSQELFELIFGHG